MDLKADLDNYLNRSNGSKSTFSNLAQGFKLPTLPKTPFSNSSVPDEDAVSLLEEGQDTLGWFGAPNAKNNESCSCLPSLSKKQRALGFMTFLGLGVICFGLALAYIPVLVIYARKFSLLFSLGSCFTMGRITTTATWLSSHSRVLQFAFFSSGEAYRSMGFFVCVGFICRRHLEPNIRYL